ncbi:hypothetical protein B0H13DRAFT_1971574 [Mycena leptocephala]|nr:hypothetical protein B0H13DRAFT_1971574 [Mycena leptocephala]
MPSGRKSRGAPTVFLCDGPGCWMVQDLKKCSKCRMTVYCSRTCQVRDWPQHKKSCRCNVAAQAVTGGETAIQRDLRNWVFRFRGTLQAAIMRGLNLKNEWHRIGRDGLLILLKHRPHENSGSRFFIVVAAVLPNDELLELPGLAHQCRHVLQIHVSERARLQEKHKGAADYASVFLVACDGARMQQ